MSHKQKPTIHKPSIRIVTTQDDLDALRNKLKAEAAELIRKSNVRHHGKKH